MIADWENQNRGAKICPVDKNDLIGKIAKIKKPLFTEG